MFLYVHILTISSILNSGSLSLIPSLKVICVTDFTSTGLILIFLWYVLLYIFPLSSNLLIYSFFDIEVIYLWISFFMVLINFLGTTNFPSLCIDYISIVKLTAFICPCFVWVAIWFFSIFLKSISNCNTYFIFQTNNACVFTGNIKKN